jgi:hypothetical protein
MGHGHARSAVVASGGVEEDERARSLILAKYAPRADGDLTALEDRALPVGIDLAASSPRLLI